MSVLLGQWEFFLTPKTMKSFLETNGLPEQTKNAPAKLMALDDGFLLEFDIIGRDGLWVKCFTEVNEVQKVRGTFLIKAPKITTDGYLEFGSRPTTTA